jgi:uncharacterized membrane protein
LLKKYNIIKKEGVYMKRIVKFLSLFFVMMMPLTLVKAVSNDYFHDENNDNVINHSVFIGDDNVKYNHQVNGIAFIAGNNVLVTGNEDYGCIAGNNVNFNGNIQNDLFIAGNNVSIISSENTIGRDLYAAGNVVTISENINGNAFVAGDEVVLKDITINGDINISAEKVNIEGNVIITGTFKVNDNAKVTGEDNLTSGNKETYANNDKKIVKNNFVSTITGLAMLLILGFVLHFVFPKVYEKANKKNDTKSILMNMLYGLLVLIIVPIISIILMCTIIGTMLGIIIILLYVITLLISAIIASMVAGKAILNKLFKTSDNAYLSITIGLVLFKLFELIPYVGTLIYFLIFIFGLGKIYDLFKTRNE